MKESSKYVREWEASHPDAVERHRVQQEARRKAMPGDPLYVKACFVRGCERNGIRQGMCVLHHGRSRRGGDVTVSLRPRKAITSYRRAHIHLEAVRGTALDHVVPLSRCGTNDPSNIHTAHRVCNSQRRLGEVSRGGP